MIPRPTALANARRLLKTHRVVAILGARQVGKTTLARELARTTTGVVKFFDLENSVDRAKLADPMLALAGLKGLVVLDEIQHVPEVFRALRVLADRPRGARYLVLGSAAPELLRQNSETLAGRIAHLELSPLSLIDVGANALSSLWLRGGFPRSFVLRTIGDSSEWRRNFLRTFLERDIPQLGIGVSAATLRRFWSMLAHLHGQTLNLSELGRSLGVADTTVRHYLDILEGTFMAWQLLPWHENIGKRQVKAPKIYLSDSGILHSLLGIESLDGLEGHPKVGASWEGLCIGTLLAHLNVRAEERFFWATHAGAELDLLVVRDGIRRGYEVKRTSSPSMTASMRHALDDLGLESLDIIYSGWETFRLGPKVRAVPLSRVIDDIPPLRRPSKSR